MTTNEAITKIHSMSTAELDLAVQAIKLRRTALARSATRSLSVGDRVRFTTRSGETIRGSVGKLNRKTAIVNTGGQQWRVTASMLTAC